MKNKVFFFYLIIPVSLIILTWNHFHFMSNDGVQYITLGYNLFHHSVFNDPYGVVPGIFQSPGYPVYLGFLSIFFDSHYIGYTGNFIVSFAIALLIYFFSKKCFDSAIASVATIILLFNPLFLFSIFNGSSEPLYTLTHLAIFVLIYKPIKDRTPFSFIRIIIIAALATILFLIRSEGILYILFIFLFIPFYHIYILRRSIKADFNLKTERKFIKIYIPAFLKMLIFLVIVAGILFPYGQWIKKQTGTFNIVPKIKFNSRIGVVARLESLPSEYQHNEEYIQEMLWFGLDKNNHELYANQILNDNYYFSLNNQIIQKPSIQSLFHLLYKNILGTVKVLYHSNPFPIFFMLILIVSSFILFRTNLNFFILVVIWLLPSFYFFVSHVEERFFYAFLPYLSFIIALGIQKISRKYTRELLINHILVLILLINSSYYIYRYYQQFQKNEDFYKAAQIIKDIVPERSKITAKNFSITFFSGHNFAKMPICSIDNLYMYLKKQKVDFLLLGDEVNDLRFEFKPIYEEKPSSYFDLTRIIDTPSQKFKLFKVL